MERMVWGTAWTEVRCVDNLTRSRVNACAQVLESPCPCPRPPTPFLVWLQFLEHFVEEFAVALTNYFDDFVTFAIAYKFFSVTGCMECVLKTPSWLFAQDGDLAPGFSYSVSAPLAFSSMSRTCIVK